MGKRKVPGVSKSKGMQDAFILYPPGKYVFEVINHTEKESAKGTAIIHTFKLKCTEALAKENSSLVDRLYFHRMIEMTEDHSSYEEYSYIFVDELKSFLDAAGVSFKGDTVDFEEFLGKAFIATIVQSDSKDAEGAPRKDNRITKYESAS